MFAGVGGSLIAVSWSSGWLWSSKRGFLKASTSSFVVMNRDRLSSSHLSDSSSSTRVSMSGASSAFLLTQR